jgi:hypothetical protein
MVPQTLRPVEEVPIIGAGVSRTFTCRWMRVWRCLVGAAPSGGANRQRSVPTMRQYLRIIQPPFLLR